MKIEYKVWSVKDKEFLTGYRATNYFIDCDGYLVKIVDGDRAWNKDLMSRDDFKVVYYTGVCDRDGRKVYDGDFVEYRIIEDIYEAYTLPLPLEVYWDDNRLTWRLKGSDQFGTIITKDLPVSAWGTSIKVIRNKFEV